jgi:cardiolipin synthase
MAASEFHANATTEPLAWGARRVEAAGAAAQHGRAVIAALFDSVSVLDAVGWGLRLLALVVVPPRRSAPSASSWLLLIFLLPELGFVLYLFAGRARTPERVRRRRADFPGLHPGVLDRVEKHVKRHAAATLSVPAATARLVERLGRFRPLAGNEVVPCSDYDACVRRLVADIDAAREHVHVISHIFGHDAVGDAIGAALVRAAKRGVVCRVLADAIGTGRGGRRRLRDLRREGVRTAFVAPINLLRAMMHRADMRNHRKIAVIDGRIAHVGSQNLVDKQFKRDICYEDLAVRVVGPVVLQLQIVFLADWHVATGEALDVDALLPETGPAGTVIAQALPSGPSFPDENFRLVLVDLLHGARDRVVLVTPYFVPDESMIAALTTAALRGADVSVIIPAKSDSRLVTLAQNAYVAELERDGVEMFHYLPAFLHAKHTTIDDEITLVGSSNIDIRSFALNEEISLVVYDRGVCDRFRAEQERLLARSKPVILEEWLSRPLLRRWLESVARLFSPVL